MFLGWNIAAVIRLSAVRAIFERLQAIADAHSHELRSDVAPGEWEAVLAGRPPIIEEPVRQSFRIPRDLSDRIDRAIKELADQTGLPVSRSAVVRKLLSDGLDKMGIKAEPKKKARRRK